MKVSALEWSIALGVTTAVLLFDLLVIGRRPHEPTVRECVVALSVYVGMAVGFGIWIWIWSVYGEPYGERFFAGWLTEYSLSVDNLFVFLIIMASFKVPKVYQQEALMVGVVLALVFRGVLIALGAVAIDRFSWTFYIFGGFLVWVAVNLFRDTERDSGAENAENAVVRLARSYLNTTDTWDGLKLYVKDGDQRLITPMFLVILALGTTDLVFALDSIPAIFGLTRQPYLVFATNVFALMGLRQLYFLFGELFHRLVYLSKGLAVILVFIAAEMIFDALRENELSFVNDGKPFDLPEIPVPINLGVVVATLAVTTAGQSLQDLHQAGVAVRIVKVRLKDFVRCASYITRGAAPVPVGGRGGHTSAGRASSGTHLWSPRLLSCDPDRPDMLISPLRGSLSWATVSR